MFGKSTVFAIVLAMTAVYAGAGDFSFRVSEAPEWNRLFQRTNGWIGADVAYSVPLGPEKTLWLFGDTFVGQVRNGKRTSAKMIHSSIAIQHFGEEPQFYYPTDKEDEPQSLIESLGPRTYFWLNDGAQTDQGLYIFLQQVQWLNDSAWGFRCVGTWLASVQNPDTSPALWKISRKKLPFTQLADGQTVILGCEILKTGNYLYIYGYSNHTNATAVKNQILARASENSVSDPGTWEFYSHGTWTKDFEQSTPIFSGTGAEGSVSWQPFLNKFVFVYSPGIQGAIVMRTAKNPEGPWSAPIKLYQCPDMKFAPHVFCYAAKGHPELSATNELLVSYASNSTSLSEVMNDPRIYSPHFIRVTFEKPFSNVDASPGERR
jgi:hypothetical protein